MSSNLRFLDARSDVAALMRAHDWSSSPLGAPEHWPQSLRSIVSLMLSSSFPMFLAWGPGLGMLYNDPYAEILGGKHPQALGAPFQDVWAEIWADIGPLKDRALAGESVFQENLPLTMRRRGFDEQTWFTFSYSPIFDENGDVAGMYCACTETTGAVLAARGREREIERLRMLFDQAPGIVAVLAGPDHVFELANHAYVELVGARDLIGKPVRTALPEIEGQGLFELLDRVYRDGEPFVGRAVPVLLRRGAAAEDALEERFVDFVYQPIRDEAGRVSGIFVEGSDVTDAVRAMQAVQESEQQLRQLVNTIHHLAWIAGPDGLVDWYNDRWYEFTGTTPDQVLGTGWARLVFPEDLPRVQARWAESLASGRPYEVTTRLRGADGAYRLFFIRAAAVRDATGRVVHWFGTNTDITEAQAAQDALREANRRKDEFLAMLAHELRNPLAPISTAARLLRMPARTEAHVEKAADIITRQVDHMIALVDDLLDVSRVTRGLIELETAPLDLGEVVADAVEQVRPLVESRGHALSVQIADPPPYVHGDRTRLTQVVSNLLNNAAKYTPQGGRIALRLRTHEGSAIVEVEDNGVGIEASLLPQVFTLFTQAERTPDRSQGGLGIGLALVRRIVELHGGRVDAHSAGPGRGATFVVTLPIDEGTGSASEATSRPGAAAPAVRSVMVVDDNVDAAESMALLLRMMGCEVAIHTSAPAALEDARRRDVDAFVLDIGLPGMDGYELARHLRAEPRTANALMIALTGYGQAHDRVLSRSAGFDAHLVKPADPDRLLEVLARGRDTSSSLDPTPPESPGSDASAGHGSDAGADRVA